MRHLIGLSLAVLFLGGAGVSPAAAANGAFTFISTTSRTCIEDTEGFDANLQPIPVPSFLPGGTHFVRATTYTDAGQGILDIGGTLSSSLDGTTIRNPGESATPVTSTHSDCTGTWAIDRNGDGIVQTQSTCTFSTTAGGTSTGTVTGVTAAYRLIGAASATPILVHVGPVPPVVEAVHVNQNGATEAFDYQRVCTRTTTLYFVDVQQ